MASNRCKLCRAFAASGIPTAAERRLAGSDQFDRDADICNACLASNYAAKQPRITIRMRVAMYLAVYAAVIVAAAIATSTRGVAVARALHGPRIIRLMETYIIVMLAIIVPCWLVVWIMLFLHGKFASRADLEKGVDEPESKQIAAERLLWLAVWASITGRDRFRLRILRSARKSGFFVDVQHRTIRPIAAPS
ncbi:MAG TPA: hypothetical protein VH370_10800 [Humisphaera sp.]|jgi:hypothetical protein|nr:hypothetical protein [Humisphaera sp.]